ncbi:hypothetical protein Btru_019228 [Bulinus truncatus]|nr:hypothetical protein Btru_019228 [Bulinus truncatus]
MNHHVAPLIRCSEKLVELARKRGLFVSQDVIKGKVRQVQDNFRTLKRNIKRSWPQMKNHLEQDFNFTQKRQPERRSPVNQAAKRSKLGDKENHSVSPAAPCTPLPSPLSTLQPAAPDTPQLAGTTPTRHSARCCHHRRLISLTAGLKERLERAKAEVRVLKKIFQTSRINQELRRKNSLIEKLLSQVSVAKAGQLVRFILNELTQTSVGKMPASSTIAQMAYEMGVMSNLQLAENLYMTHESATLAWDATSIDGTHYNEINISLGDRTFTLEVGKLSGGATIDYFQHIGNSAKDLGTLYAIFTGTQQHLILYKFQQTIQTTLSDRAPVNNCVSQELGHLLCKQLVKLNCNLHPLDGLATEAKKTLKLFDARCKEKCEILIPVMKTCIIKLQAIGLDPECLIHWTTDSFERPVNTEDQVLRALRGAAACDLFREVTKSLSEAFCRVLEKQLADYLEGTLSIVTDELLQKTSSAPLHNMHSERALVPIMVNSAIEALKERGGSSRQAILKYIVANYKLGDNPTAINARLKAALKAGVKAGALKQSKGTGAAGSFRIGEKKKVEKPKAAKKVAEKKPKSPKKAAKPKKPAAAAAKKATKSPKKTAAKKPAAPKKAKSPKKVSAAKPKKPKTPKKAVAAKPKAVKKPAAAKKAKPTAKKAAAAKA